MKAVSKEIKQIMFLTYCLPKHTVFLELSDCYHSPEHTFCTEKKGKIDILELWREKSTKVFFMLQFLNFRYNANPATS